MKFGARKILGREGLVDAIARELEEDSVRLIAPKRFGKTQVLKLLQTKFQSEVFCAYVDCSHMVSPIEFAEVLYEQSRAALSRKKKLLDAATSVWKSLGGSEIAGIKLPTTAAGSWKRLISACLADLKEHGVSALLLLDEFPAMIYTFRSQEGGDAIGLEFMLYLRAVRQESEHIRMVLSGTSGLIELFADLDWRRNFQSDPTNDLRAIFVDPLDLKSASNVALAQMERHGIDRLNKTQKQDLAELIATTAGRVPFYINRACSDLTNSGIDYTSESSLDDVEAYLVQLIASPLDPWRLGFFETKLQVIFDPLVLELVHKILAKIGEHASGLVETQYWESSTSLIRDYLNEQVSDREGLSRLGLGDPDPLVWAENIAWKLIQSLYIRRLEPTQHSPGQYSFAFEPARLRWLSRHFTRVTTPGDELTVHVAADESN